jgi:hypothetical protein
MRGAKSSLKKSFSWENEFALWLKKHCKGGHFAAHFPCVKFHPAFFPESKMPTFARFSVVSSKLSGAS